MVKSVYLTLLMGPTIPVPVPPPVVEALTAAQVTVTAGQRGGFQLSFSASKEGLIQRALLPAGFFDPKIRVILMATVNGIPHVLSDGVIVRQELTASSQPGQSILTVTGEDLTLLMDLIQLKGIPFPGVPEEARLAMLIGKYAIFGIIPLIVPRLFPDVSLPIQRIEFQEGTDLAYIQELAKKNGYVFYLEPGPAPGANVAYWGPEIRIGVPQPALNVDMDAHTNVESLNFSYDGSSREQLAVTIQEPLTKLSIPVPVPEISLLKPPLALRQATALKLKFLPDAAKLSVPQALAQAVAKSSDSSDAITGSGQLDVLRYGRPLRARSLVGVRGAGLAYDGLYFVKSVTHDFKPGAYKQSFTLARNGLISLLPVVPP